MKKTVNEFCDYLVSRVGVSLYTLGAQGQNAKAWIRELVEGLERRYSANPEENIKRTMKLLDEMMPETNNVYLYDCSGLGVAWLLEQGLIERDYTANSMYTQLCTKVSKSELRKGDWVFVRNNKTGNISHVGYIVDDTLNVVESKGRDDGVVKRPLSAGDWNVFGRPNIFPEEVQKETAIISRVLRLTSPYMRGEDVRALQEAIRALGITVDVDGIFGPGTEAALTIAQKQLFPGSPSEWDGQAGKRTVTALGLVWAV